MNEKLLQFIWQFQYFNRGLLADTEGRKIEIIHPGMLNDGQGPDFKNAKIKIGDTLWAGSVELHLKTSGWVRHAHTGDDNYKNVILHVVYQHDDDAAAPHLPVLALQGRIAHHLLSTYAKLLAARSFIPCSETIHTVPQIVIAAWLETCAVQRLQRKSQAMLQQYEESKGHWEEVFWWNLCRNFGIKTNAAAFEKIARSIPVQVLARHRGNLIQTEALLLGQAGLLQGNFADPYPAMLQREYHFFKNKLNLQPIYEPVYFLRMRPGNFPTVRLAQLAALLHGASHLFSFMLTANNLQAVKEKFDAMPNDYWQYHYTLKDDAFYKIKPIGAGMVENIIINTIVPILFAYATYHKEEALKDKALPWLQQLTAEKNNITTGFKCLGLPLSSAFESQAYVELKTQYCDVKRCLHCAIGNSILKQSNHA